MPNKSDFEKTLISLETDCGPHEGTMMVLVDWLNKQPSLVEIVKERYRHSNDESLKELHASLITRVDDNNVYKEYLKSQHQWTDEDFEDH